MSDEKSVPESDAARSGENADKNRDALSKAAEKGLERARQNKPGEEPSRKE
jgi:hypothetical protein